MPAFDKHSGDHHRNRADQPFELAIEASVFHVLRESDCPYLPEKRERKLLTELVSDDDPERYDLLSRGGFRRSHSFAYRPACATCQACKPVRVPVAEFKPSRSQRRVARLNSDLLVAELPATANDEQFRLFQHYLTHRHGDGEMASMDFDDYQGMVEQTTVPTRVVEFRDQEGTLIAVLLADWLKSGASAVYSFFDPRHERRSLGTYMVLWLIQEALTRGLQHVYLGYWIAETEKMAYKARFHPLENLTDRGWRPIKGAKPGAPA